MAGDSVDVNALTNVARDVVRQMRRGLFSAGLYRALKEGGVQQVRFSAVQATADGGYVLVVVDTSRLPVGVTVPKLVDGKVLHHLSGVVGRPVRVINSTGVVYAVDLRPQRPRVKLPTKVPLDMEKRPNGNYMLPMGVTHSGDLWLPLPKLLHILVGGSTNQGKTNLLHAFIVGLLMAHTPQEVALYLVDTKMVEFTRYYGMPWVQGVATDVDAALDLLRSVIAEMERRQDLFMEAGRARFFDAYQGWARRNGKDLLPRIVVIVDEIADVVLSGGGQVRDDLARLASKGRAFGIHLILATQRPDREVLRGLTKVNLPTRIAFRVPGHMDSQLILGRSGAEKLPAVQGRYLLLHGSRTAVVQAYYVPDSMFDVLRDRASADFGYEPQAVPLRKVGHSGKITLSKIERALAEAAADELDGAFKINALYERFRGQVSKNTIQNIAASFERRGLLTPKPANPTQPRRMTPKLYRLIGRNSGEES